jgi:hypothetical protein
LDVFWGQDSNLIQVVFIGVGHRQKVGPVEDLADRLAFLETEVLGYVYNNAPLRDNMTRSEGSLKDVLGETLRSNPRG